MTKYHLYLYSLNIYDYLIRSKDFYVSLNGMGVQNMTVCRLTEDSLLMFGVFDTDKEAQAVIEKTTEWRKINRFEFLDIIVLDGKIDLFINKALSARL